MNIREELFALRDEGYAAFQQKLIPGVPPACVIGVRVPELRKLAKRYYKDPEHYRFLQALPHDYYDEDLLHALLIAEEKDFACCLEETEAFLPFVDNWAVCDIISPKVFSKHKEELSERIRVWAKSEKTYTCRFGIGMLMQHFLDADFDAAYLEIPAAVHSEEYYVNMMLAWFFATALAKQWEATIPYLENKRLPCWTHNKAIQKARESYRISAEQKEYLKSLKC